MSKAVDQQQIPVEYLSLSQKKQNLIERTYDAGQHVYFIKAKKVNLVKVGAARNPAQRLKSLQIGSPVELKLLFVIPYGGYMIESKLHKDFKQFHNHGEWFNYTPEIRQRIKDIKLILREQGWTRFANQLLKA